MAGAGEDDHFLAGFLGHDLAHPQLGTQLDALGDGYHNGILINIGGHASADAAHGGGGAGDDHHLTAAGAGVIGRNGKTFGQNRGRQPGVPAGGLHFGNQFFFKSPHGHFVTVFVQPDGQGSTPGTAADNSYLHALLSFLKQVGLALVSFQ